jgi:hypothetical protein
LPKVSSSVGSSLFLCVFPPPRSNT